MRSFVFIAGLLCAGFALACTGCKPEPTPTAAPVEKAAQPNSKQPEKGVQQTKTTVVVAPTRESEVPPLPKEPEKRPRLATQIADLMIREGELRLKLDATTDNEERRTLIRQIEETERKRLDLYNSITETK